MSESPHNASMFSRSIASASASASEPRAQDGDEATDSLIVLWMKLNQLRNQIRDKRNETVKEKLERNRKIIQCQVSAFISATSRRDTEENTTQMLSSRMHQPLYKFKATSRRIRETDEINNQDESLLKSVKIPRMQRVPPFACWVHFTRNQKMTEDESVIGKRQIYYDEHGCETLLSSDDDGEYEDPKDAKHEFSEGEDQVLWMAFEEHGLTEDVLTIVSEFVGGTISEIEDRYNHLKEKNQHSEDCESHFGICLDKSLGDALDTLDNFFCRQCLVFNCPLHGCSQPVIYPSEKQLPWSDPESDKKPCSDQCYLQKERNDFHEDLNSDMLALESTGKRNYESMIDSDWKPPEKDLYLKGVEIFGKNSCLISQNLLPGLKTCMEVASYMEASEVLEANNMDKKEKSDVEGTNQKARSRSTRRKGKSKKLRFSSKSTGHSSMWKRTTHVINKTNKQYTPCGCQGICGKECACLLIGSCCEKYCGCSKLCKNRFRGCHCVKSQCKTRQCPCFAAGRECDPDVCQNCWISCGDGSLGEPPKRGDSQCGNTRILLGQKQKILWAKSDVVGWGAFLKDPAEKNDFLGEYTGEMVTHSEADKRGKLYDRVNSSYLFNLNDQYALDAYRKGDKLKFANHSSKPNCYAKVLFVGGDHRVGIFAKERIKAGEELFYDYNYNQDSAPAWALKSNGSNRNESKVSRGRARKNSSC